MFSSLLPFTHIIGQRSRCWGEAGWSNGLQGNTAVPCSLPPQPAKQAADENGSGGGVLLFLSAQQRDKAAGYAGVFSFTHLSTHKLIQTERQQQLICTMVLFLPTSQKAWARGIFSPFLLLGMMQKLAHWNFHRKGGSGQTEDPADQIWPVGCMLNHAGKEFSKVICVSLTTSTDCAVHSANAKSFWKIPSISGHKDFLPYP